MRLTHRQAVAGMVVATAMWSIAGVVSRQLHQAQGLEVTFWRSAFTALALLVILPLWRGKDWFARVQWRSRSLWLLSLTWGVMFTAFMFALTVTTVANVLIMEALGPLFTALVARAALAHKLPLRTWIAIALAGVGIAWMYGPQLRLHGSDAVLLGTLVALLVPVTGAVKWTVTQRAQSKQEDVDYVPSVLLGAAFSALITLPFAWPFRANAGDLAWLGLLGVVQLAIPSAIAMVCAKVLSAPELALLGLLEVIFGIALAWVGAGESPGAHALAGGALVIAALVFNELLGWRQKA